MKPYYLLMLATLVFIIAPIVIAQNCNDLILPCMIYDAGRPPISGNHSPYLRSDNKQITNFFETDQIHMVRIGDAPGPLYYSMVGGDADHDNRFDIYMYVRDNEGGATFTYRIYENDGTNHYPLAYRSTQGMIPYAFGDTDSDSLPDVIGQDGYWVEVYESPSLGELPTQMVWQSPQLMNVTGYTAIGDLDQDGQQEIIHTQNSFGSDNRLVIFECTGNNQYQQIFNQQVSDANIGTKAIADFDQDGLMDVAFSSGNGDIYVYESPGNNQFQLAYQTRMNAYNAYACSYANDMNGNGRPEFIVGGSSSDLGWVTQIYEAIDNNNYVITQEIVINDGYFGLTGNAVGDFDGDGIPELVIQCALSLHIYKWNGTMYAEEEVIPENFGYIQHGIFSYDNNNNGYGDLFWLGLGDSGYWTNLTIVLENEFVGPPNVTVTLTPDSLPIIISQPTGGSFDFNFRVDYQESPASEFIDGWLMIQSPDSSWSGPAMGVWSIPVFAPGMNYQIDTTYTVEADLDTGTYLFKAFIGMYPDSIWDTDSFTFQVIPGSSVPNFIKADIPADYALLGNYPNPFNPITTISFAIPAATKLNLSIYDITGRKVATLLEGPYQAGIYRTAFNGSSYSSGVYFYCLQADNFNKVGKMVLLK
jgi:hypothetical protein